MRWQHLAPALAKAHPLLAITGRPAQCHGVAVSEKGARAAPRQRHLPRPGMATPPAGSRSLAGPACSTSVAAGPAGDSRLSVGRHRRCSRPGEVGRAPTPPAHAACDTGSGAGAAQDARCWRWCLCPAGRRYAGCSRPRCGAPPSAPASSTCPATCAADGQSRPALQLAHDALPRAQLQSLLPCSASQGHTPAHAGRRTCASGWTPPAWRPPRRPQAGQPPPSAMSYCLRAACSHGAGRMPSFACTRPLYGTRCRGAGWGPAVALGRAQRNTAWPGSLCAGAESSSAKAPALRQEPAGRAAQAAPARAQGTGTPPALPGSTTHGDMLVACESTTIMGARHHACTMHALAQAAWQHRACDSQGGSQLVRAGGCSAVQERPCQLAAPSSCR